jgi:nucleotide-binding universal stress UspA family protein
MSRPDKSYYLNAMPTSTALVPLDGSLLAEQVLDYLPTLKGIGQFRVTLISVAPDEDSHPRVSAYLDELASRTQKNTGLMVDWVSHVGLPYAHILARAVDPGVDLLLMATHGRNSAEPWRLGSVADKVIRGTPCPALLIGPEAASRGAPHAIRRVLCPLDGSSLAEEALPVAKEMAERLHARLRIATAYLPQPVPPIPWPDRSFAELIGSSAEAAADYLANRYPDVEAIERVTELGLPGEVLLNQLAEGSIDLVVMMSHGRHGFVKWALGSVTDRLIRGPTPVLVMQPGQSSHLVRLLSGAD